MIKDMEDYCLKNNLRERTLCQIYNLILCVEGKIENQAEKILRMIYKNILDEDKDISNQVSAYHLFKIVQEGLSSTWTSREHCYNHSNDD
jgi:hypothetical protein